MALMNKVELLKKLGELANPYTWRTEINIVRKQELLEKLEEIVENEGFKIESFIINLVLFYEYIQDNELSNAQEVIRHTEKLLNHFNEIPNNEKQPLFWKCRKALRYILEMSKCHLLILNNLIQEANKIFKKAMNNVNLEERYTKAALKGLEANYLICYSCREYPRIIHLLEGAIELESDQDYWHFLLGKILARRRRLISRFALPADNKEMESFEKAYALRKSASNACFLAQSLREHTNINYSNSKNFLTPDIKEKLNKDNERALELFKEALKLNGQCAHINIRCSVGFLKLPYPYKNMRLAKRCLFKAKNSAPNNLMLLQRLGLIYKREDNIEQAKKYFQDSADGGCFGSYMELFSMQLQLKERDIYDIIKALEKLILKYEKDPPIIINIYIQLGWAMYLFENNLYEAVKYWERPIQVADTYSNVTLSKSSLKYSEGTFNILEIVSDEIRFAIQNQHFQNPKELQLYKRIIEFFNKKYPELLTRKPQKRRDAILENCKKNQLEYDRALQCRRESYKKFCARKSRRESARGGRGRAAAHAFSRNNQSRSTSRTRNVPFRLPTESDSDDSNISAKDYQNKWRAGCRGSRNSSVESNRSISPQIPNNRRTKEQQDFLASIRPALEQIEQKRGSGSGSGTGRGRGRGRGRGGEGFERRGGGNVRGRSQEGESKSSARDRFEAIQRQPSSDRNFSRGRGRRNSPADLKRIELYQNQKEEEFRQTLNKIKNIQINPPNPAVKRRASPTNILQDLNKRLENLNKLDVKWNQSKIGGQHFVNETSHLASRVEKIDLNAEMQVDEIDGEENQKRNDKELEGNNQPKMEGQHFENETSHLASRVEKIDLNAEMQVDEEKIQKGGNNEEENKTNKKQEKLKKLFQSAQWKGRLD